MVITFEYLNAHTHWTINKTEKELVQLSGNEQRATGNRLDLIQTLTAMTDLSNSTLYSLLATSCGHLLLTLCHIAGSDSATLPSLSTSPRLFYCSLTCRVRVNLAQIRDETRRDWRLPLGCGLAQSGLLGRGQLAAHLACLVSCQPARFGNEMFEKKTARQREEKNKFRLWWREARVALNFKYTFNC